ncbi:MAG: hypothetical protein P8125_07240 [Gemmatimonadota bacterium]
MAALCLIAAPPSVSAQEQVPEISVETLGENLWVIRDGLGSGNVLLYDIPGGRI